MSQSPQIQSRIDEIAKVIHSGETKGLVEKFGKKWNLKKTSINNYIKLAKPIAKGLSKIKDKAVTDAIVSETTEAVKQGLKSKYDRVMILQEHCQQIENDLLTNISPDYMIIGGKLQKVLKDISVTDRAYLRRTLKDLLAEISKIEGDYPAKKVEIGGKNGQPIQTENTSIVLYLPENRRKNG